MKKTILLTLLLSAQANAADSLDIGVNMEVCDSWYYSVCDQSYVIDVYAEYTHQINSKWYWVVRGGHKSHPEKADMTGPDEEQTGYINYGSIGIKRRFQW